MPAPHVFQPMSRHEPAEQPATEELKSWRFAERVEAFVTHFQLEVLGLAQGSHQFIPYVLDYENLEDEIGLDKIEVPQGSPPRVFLDVTPLHVWYIPPARYVRTTRPVPGGRMTFVAWPRPMSGEDARGRTIETAAGLELVRQGKLIVEGTTWQVALGRAQDKEVAWTVRFPHEGWRVDVEVIFCIA